MGIASVGARRMCLCIIAALPVSAPPRHPRKFVAGWQNGGKHMAAAAQASRKNRPGDVRVTISDQEHVASDDPGGGLAALCSSF